MSDVDTDTLQLILSTTPIPIYSDVDAICDALQDIIQILQHPEKNNIPVVLKGDSIRDAFWQAATLINNVKCKVPEQKKTYADTLNSNKMYLYHYRNHQINYHKCK